ncbi:DUF7260 family protein [Halorarius halobius]|uniref:DUF7260 family protein n=1 Tax=Halorarius halobius TaxID=2962671 RepID=UPI0020CF2BC1|nr:hypothetical protein [Halorarius halobius]
MHITTMTVVSVGDPTGLGVACTPAGCFQVVVLLRAVVIGLSGLLGVLGALSYLADASQTTREERRRVRAERDALESFIDRVRALSPTTPSADHGAGYTPAVLTSQSGPDAAAVGEAYRETMLSVDHYEEDYGEPLGANLRAELGPDVANALASGGPLTPDLQQAVVAAGEQARTEREAFLTELGTEADALAESAERLQSIEAALDEARAAPDIDDFESLADRWQRLDRLEAACVAVVDDRRASLSDRDAFDLSRYLYESVGPPYPVVAAAADLLGEVRVERDRTTDMLTRVV